MKRIALLLAAVGLGSGCVVDTCENQSLTIDWRFIDANGTTNLLCGEAGVTEVDVYIDGTQVVFGAPCGPAMALDLFDTYTGTRRVVIEGYGGAGGTTFLSRDWIDLNIASCGNTYWQSNPGRGYLEFQPTGCSVNDGNLLYSLRDVTLTPGGYVFDQIDSTSGAAIQTYTCTGGIFYLAPIPYGEYSLVGLEEVPANLSTTYSSHCAAVAARVDFDSPTFFSPDTTIVSPAMSTIGPSCGL